MHVAWDITGLCNLSCIHCYNSRLYTNPSSQDLVEDLRTSEAFKIIDKLAEGKVDSIQFLGGEPFVRPDFLSILTYSKSKILSSRIATNGVLLNKNLIEELAVICPEQIAFSIDGATPRSNDAIRGAGTFDRVVNNLKLLSDYFRDNGVKTRIAIQCTLTRLNKHEIENMVDLGKELHVNSIGFEPFLLYARNIAEWNRLKELILDSFELFAVGEKISSLISSNQDKIGIKMATVGSPKFRKYLNHKYGVKFQVGRSCPAASDVFYIRADGITHPCNYCSDFDERMFLQKVNKENLDLKVLSFEEVVDSEYFRTFYYFAHNGEICGKIGYCRECEFYKICEPCPLDIVQFGNDVASECMSFEKYLREADRML